MIEDLAGSLAEVIADPAYDTQDVYDAAAARGAAVVIPPIAPALRAREEMGRQVEARLGV